MHRWMPDLRADSARPAVRIAVGEATNTVRPVCCIVLIVLVLAGCGSNSGYMPLAPNREWRYYARSPEGDKVMSVKVVGPIRVGNVDGWLLTGPGGSSRLAWSNGVLIASELNSVRFDPPITLLDPSEKTTGWNYSGTAMGRIGSSQIEAVCKQRPDTITVGGVSKSTLHVTIQFRLGSANLSLETWYASGVGILRQEQLTNGNQVAALDWISNR